MYTTTEHHQQLSLVANEPQHQLEGLVCQTLPLLLRLLQFFISFRDVITVSNKASLQNQLQNSRTSDPEESNEAFDRAIR